MGINGVRAGSSKPAAQTVLCVAVFLAAGARAAPSQEKSPVPDEAAQAEAKELVRQIYGPDYEKAESDSEKAAVARKVLSQALATKDDPASHFVLLDVARKMAVGAADAMTALEAVDQTARHYQVDASTMQVEAVLEAAGNVRTSDQRKTIVLAAMPLIRAALDEDDYPTANRLAPKVLELARRSRDVDLMKRVAAINKEIAESEAAYAEVASARAVLEEKPTDPEANLTVGRYTCFVKGDWRRGVPMLALGSDGALRAQAAKELEGPTSTDEEVAVGDGWWELATAEQSDAKEAMMLRAGSWYRWAQERVSGLVKMKIERRMEEIGAERIAELVRTVHHPPFTFDDPSAMAEYWIWNGEWTMGADGGKAPRAPKSILRTRYAYGGELSIDMDFSLGGARFGNTGGCWITLWGKRLLISNFWRTLTAKIHIHRDGDEIVYVLNGREQRIAVEPDIGSKPTVVDLYWRTRTSHFRRIEIKAETMVAAN